MEVGIVGLPRSGKTTLFRALTGAEVDGFSDKAHVGIANVPDPRLDEISTHIPTQKIVPATIRLVDIPGMPIGADARKVNQVLEQIRQVDALCQVVRGFDDGSGTVDPASDVANLEIELILADLAVAEGALDRAKRNSRSGDKEALQRKDFLEKVMAVLESEKPLRTSTDWSDVEAGFAKNYGFVTFKPQLFVVNVPEDAVGDSAAIEKLTAPLAEAAGNTGAIGLCATLESEIAELDESDRNEMLGSLGVDEPAVGPLARLAHSELGLATFYTAGEKEVRAWTIPAGATAPKAAGAIHSDIERGFIRCECYHVDDLTAAGSEKAIRDAGKWRSEGKQYHMQDGDVVLFRFNV